MAGRFIILTVLFAFSHLLLSLVSFGIAFGRGLHRIDHPEFPVTTVERICVVLVPILDEPYDGLKRLTGISQGWPDLLVGVLCTLLWGAVLSFIFLAVTRLKDAVRGRTERTAP
jgi:hypothetical protein